MKPGMITVPMTVNSSMPSSIPNLTSQQPIISSVPILNMRPDTPNVGGQKPVAKRVIGTPQVVEARPAASGKPSFNQPTHEKCRNFLANLLDLSSKEANSVERNVRIVIQELIDGQVEPEVFCDRLERLLKASPKPCLIGFLKKGLPLLRQSLVKEELVIEGIKPPSPHVAVSAIPSPTPPNELMKPSDNPKEKCRNFLASLLDLSSKEPNSVERNVRNVIQELIDGQIEPEEFCDRLERLLNASPQPCLIGFLKKSLPLLRQSLVTKELIIDGIKPPSPHVAVSAIPSPAPPAIATPKEQMELDTSSQHPQSANADLSIMSPQVPPIPPATPKEAQPSSSSEYCPRRKKTRKSDVSVDVAEALNRLQNISSINIRNEKDEFHFFGLNVASQLRQLPLYEALGVQTEIQAILTSARRRNVYPNVSTQIHSTLSASNTQNDADVCNL